MCIYTVLYCIYTYTVQNYLLWVDQLSVWLKCLDLFIYLFIFHFHYLIPHKIIKLHKYEYSNSACIPQSNY